MTEHEKIIIQTVNDYIDALKKQTTITGILWEVGEEFHFYCLICDQDLDDLEHTCIPKKRGYEFL